MVLRAQVDDFLFEVLQEFQNSLSDMNAAMIAADGNTHRANSSKTWSALGGTASTAGSAGR